uniref:Secreted protein n=1 Tax=Schistosoma curassoni TaxID=6186 RepID=A0A183KBV3_9TREM
MAKGTFLQGLCTNHRLLLMSTFLLLLAIRALIRSREISAPSLARFRRRSFSCTCGAFPFNRR